MESRIGRHGRVEIAFDFVADVLRPLAVFFGALIDRESRMLQAIVRDRVGAEILARRACRASLDRADDGVRSRTGSGKSRSVTRTIPVGACLGLLLVVPHVWRRVERDVLMVSREWGKRLGQSGPGRVVFFVESAQFGGWLHRDAHRAPQQRVEGIDPQHLDWKTTPKLREIDSATALRSSSLAEFLLHGRDWLCGDAAGDDQVEVAEVGVHVEREAVGRDEAGDVDADGGEFGFGSFAGDTGSPSSFAGPNVSANRSPPLGMTLIEDPSTLRSDPGPALWGSRNPRRCGSELLRGGGRIRLPRAFFVCRRACEAAQIEDRIADDLAGAMESDVAAAVAFEEFDAALGEEFGRRDYIGGFGVAAERDDRLVFEQEQDVADLFFFAQSDQLLLQAKAGRVVDSAELDERDQILSNCANLVIV